MAANPGRLGMWLKTMAISTVLCVGGPAFVMWVQPTEEELFKRYSPELQKKSLEGRYEKQKDFDDFVIQLKEYAKSDKPIWVIQDQVARKRKKDKMQQDIRNAEEAKARKEAMRKESGLPPSSKS